MFALSILFCKQGSAIERLLNDKAHKNTRALDLTAAASQTISKLLQNALSVKDDALSARR